MTKTLIITGASSGIGLAIAEEFISKGFDVFNLSRRPSPLEKVESLQVDLASESDLTRALAKLTKSLSKNSMITLVHNAFFYVPDSVDHFDSEAIQKSFQVGVMAPMLINKTLLPLMGEGSSILFMGSTLSEKAVAGALSYVTLKHAIAGLMRATTQDLFRYKGVHSCCICPGFTRTPMLEEHLKDKETYKLITSKVLFERLLEPKEIADFTYFCSQNPQIHGSTLHANLGQVES